jgi:arsenate reductase-like glutaredoxin family protein
MRAVKGQDPMKYASPVQEYEERKSITREELENLIGICDRTWHSLQDDETEEYRDLYQQEQRANKELRHTIEKEMR